MPKIYMKILLKVIRKILLIILSNGLMKIEKIINNTSQHVSVKIEHQDNNGSGTIINAGIIINN